jgi:GPI ethanolamine phosphate transferase 3 subunit O
LNLRDLDSLDTGVAKGLLKELKEGSDFDLMMGHIIGIDSAGHTFNSGHPEIERKLLDTEHLINEVMQLMDDQTTLVIFGDHGMTDQGNHGGGSENEMRTVLFAYQKTPFPMAKNYSRYYDSFEEMDKTLKQVDLTAILAVLLDLSFPFSNLGTFHPAFARTDDLAKVHALYMKNIKQI